MLCIAAFIVFAFLGIFSATHRKLAKQAWHCVVRRVTLRPCDVNFGEEVKAHLVGKLIFRAPKTARFIDKYSEIFATIFVILSIWSFGEVMISGLYLYVYGTCNPSAVESCSLSGEACGVDQTRVTLKEAWNTGNFERWALGPVLRVGEAIVRIPDRLRTWNAADYVSETATYAEPYNAQKETLLEIIDPSCRFCRTMTERILTTDAKNAFNVTYLLYPIPGFLQPKFPYSPQLASTIEALKEFSPEKPNALLLRSDWQFLALLFSMDGPEPWLQDEFNTVFTTEQAEKRIQEMLIEIGFNEGERLLITQKAQSTEIQASLKKQKVIVEDQIRTIKIPTVLIGGRRYDSIISEAKLQNYVDDAEVK
jgi:hypothetical protein